MARILLAEDDDSLRAFLVTSLTRAGHDVTGHGDGDSAWEALEHGSYDLLLTDIVMPGLDGIALALKMAKDKPELRILMMSGYSAERQRAHNLDSLIHKVVPKPFSLKEICDAAEGALAGKF